MSKKIINPFSILIKAISVIFLILSIIIPWDNLNSEYLNNIGLSIIYYLLILYIIGVIASYLGILKANFSILVEFSGLLLSSASLGFHFVLVLMIDLSSPSVAIIIEIGFYFAIATLLLIIIERLMRKTVFQPVYCKIKEKVQKKKKVEENEQIITEKKEERKEQERKKVDEEKKIMEEVATLEQNKIRKLLERKEELLVKKDNKLKEKEDRIKELEKRLKQQEKGISREKQRKTLKTEKIINNYSIIMKICAITIFLLSLLFIVPNSDLSEFSDISKVYISIMFWLVSIGILFSFFGVINNKSFSKIEKYALNLSLFAIIVIILVQFIHSFLKSTRNINLDIGFYLIYISLILLYLDVFVVRKYYHDKLKKEPEKKEKQQPLILNWENRVETKADFPERWAMIFGEKPSEEENFKHFKEFEIEKPISTYHPNYFHQLILNEIENKGYRIEKSEKPIKEEGDSYQFQDLRGLIKGSIKVQTEGELKLLKSPILVIGITFLILSGILIVTNILLENFSIIHFLITLVIFVPFSLIFIIFYLVKSLQQSILSNVGYTNIYILEQGSAYYGREYKGIDSEEVQKAIQNPAIGFKITLSFATSVKMMDIEDAKRDLDAIVEKIPLL
ncbi:MAG: hypothetical protein GF311_12535 [Candidatus Lokiarchaeota archaeon]|nr:hypothetical protein [Candidatus Lokiarchaeota archaeon]